ncbi:hypothetical protein BDW68DRAFT_195336 [Aspergillus falconensis]
MSHQIYLPLEILTQIFQDLLDELLDDADGGHDRCKNAFQLRLVSKFVRNMADKMLYKRIISPSDRKVDILARTMVARPEVAATVEEIELEEDEHANCNEEDWTDDEGEESEEDSDTDSNSDSEARPAPEKKKKPKPLAIAAEDIKRRFTAEPKSYSHALEANNLDWLALSNQKTRNWILLLQLSNLTSLTLRTHTPTFTNMALFLRLPRLEHLEFAVLAPGPDQSCGHDYVPPEETLASLISSTSRLKSLTFEDMSGDVCFPVRHDARKVKRVLDKQAAQTLTYLSVILSNDHGRDWRMEQEFSYIDGFFGSMKHFTKLEGLVVQLEALLGRPGEGGSGLNLRDVLPPQLRYLTAVNIPDYHGREESDCAWEEKDYLPQFHELAEAAKNEDHFTALESVKMHLRRKDWFNFYGDAVSEGIYEDGILEDSRIYFGWVRGPYGNQGPGPG